MMRLYEYCDNILSGYMPPPLQTLVQIMGEAQHTGFPRHSPAHYSHSSHNQSQSMKHTSGEATKKICCSRYNIQRPQNSRQKPHYHRRTTNTSQYAPPASVANTSGRCAKSLQYTAITQHLPNHYENLSKNSKRESPNSHTRDARIQIGEEGSRNPPHRTILSSDELEA